MRNPRRYTSMGVFTIALSVALLGAMDTARAAGEEKDVNNFPTVAQRSVTIWSDGTRLSGDLFYPKEREDAQKLPALVLCHGWGGTKAHLNGSIAPWFASAGYFVLTFDYRGWGESDSRLVFRGKLPDADENGMVTVSAQVIKQLVAPFDQQEDIGAAISFIEGEPGVDKEKIGLWGSSFGGGHVVWRAAHDDRVKCIASQVGPMNMVDTIQGFFEELDMDFDKIKLERTQRARGEIDPVPQGTHLIQGLTGTPEVARFLDFVAVDHTDDIKVPVLLIDAEKEHYFDHKEHGARAYKQLQGRVPVEYHVLEDTTHYAVYSGKTLEKVMKLEIDWFDKYLK